MDLASITISQAFLGAPLQFQPALGSREFAELLDAFVTGSASKQDKLSEMTIDFYNNATVDLNTGALVKTYYVLAPAASSVSAPTSAAASVPVSPWTFGQSPSQSQSSGLSPSIYTPSPSSSAANLADSGYGSFSATPMLSNRSRNGAAAAGGSSRVVKKAKKDTKKVAEMRLPGFSIMTKDGVDVTNSAGRGTKTKEQREHAHLMRIMKACGDCKRKKIKCDPSHRRSLDAATYITSPLNSPPKTSESSNKGSSAQQGKSSSATSPAHPTPPPPSSASWEYADASFYDLPASGRAMDDFVLFPDVSASWNAQAGQLENYDLGEFNFDISNVGGLDDSVFPDMNPSFSLPEEPYDFSATRQSNRTGPSPLSTYDQYDLTQWNETQEWLAASQGEPLSSSSQDSSLSAASRWMSDRHIIPRPSDALDTNATFAAGAFLERSSPGGSSTLQESPTSLSSADWSPLEGSVNANKTPQESPSPELPSVIKRHRLRDVQFSSWMDLGGSSVPADQALQVPSGTGAGLQQSEGNLGYLDIKPVPLTRFSQSPEHTMSDTSGLPYAVLEAPTNGTTRARERRAEGTSERLSILQTQARGQSLTSPGGELGAVVESVAAVQSSSHHRPASGLIVQTDGAWAEAAPGVTIGRSITYHVLDQRLPDRIGSGSQVQRPTGTMDRSGQADLSGQQLMSFAMTGANVQRDVEYVVDALLAGRASLRALSAFSRAAIDSTTINQAQDNLQDTPSTTSKARSQASSIGAAPLLSFGRKDKFRDHFRDHLREDHHQQLVSPLIGSSPTNNTRTKRIGGRTTAQPALSKSEHQQQVFRNKGSTSLSVALLFASCLLAGCLGSIMMILSFLSSTSNQQPPSLIRRQLAPYNPLPSSAARLLPSSLTVGSGLALATMLVAAYAPAFARTVSSQWNKTASKVPSLSSALSGYTHRSREGLYTPKRLV